MYYYVATGLLRSTVSQVRWIGNQPLAPWYSSAQSIRLSELSDAKHLVLLRYQINFWCQSQVEVSKKY